MTEPDPKGKLLYLTLFLPVYTFVYNRLYDIVFPMPVAQAVRVDAGEGDK